MAHALLKRGLFFAVLFTVVSCTLAVANAAYAQTPHPDCRRNPEAGKPGQNLFLAGKCQSGTGDCNLTNGNCMLSGAPEDVKKPDLKPGSSSLTPTPTAVPGVTLEPGTETPRPVDGSTVTLPQIDPNASQSPLERMYGPNPAQTIYMLDQLANLPGGAESALSPEALRTASPVYFPIGGLEPVVINGETLPGTFLDNSEIGEALGMSPTTGFAPMSMERPDLMSVSRNLIENGWQSFKELGEWGSTAIRGSMAMVELAPEALRDLQDRWRALYREVTGAGGTFTPGAGPEALKRFNELMNDPNAGLLGLTRQDVVNMATPEVLTNVAACAGGSGPACVQANNLMRLMYDNFGTAELFNNPEAIKALRNGILTGVLPGDAAARAEAIAARLAEIESHRDGMSGFTAEELKAQKEGLIAELNDIAAQAKMSLCGTSLCAPAQELAKVQGAFDDTVNQLTAVQQLQFEQQVLAVRQAILDRQAAADELQRSLSDGVFSPMDSGQRALAELSTRYTPEEIKRLADAALLNPTGGTLQEQLEKYQALAAQFAVEQSRLTALALDPSLSNEEFLKQVGAVNEISGRLAEGANVAATNFNEALTRAREEYAAELRREAEERRLTPEKYADALQRRIETNTLAREIAKQTERELARPRTLTQYLTTFLNLGGDDRAFQPEVLQMQQLQRDLTAEIDRDRRMLAFMRTDPRAQAVLDLMARDPATLTPRERALQGLIPSLVVEQQDALMQTNLNFMRAYRDGDIGGGRLALSVFWDMVSEWSPLYNPELDLVKANRNIDEILSGNIQNPVMVQRVDVLMGQLRGTLQGPSDFFKRNYLSGLAQGDYNAVLLNALGKGFTDGLANVIRDPVLDVLVANSSRSTQSALGAWMFDAVNTALIVNPVYNRMVGAIAEGFGVNTTLRGLADTLRAEMAAAELRAASGLSDLRTASGASFSRVADDLTYNPMTRSWELARPVETGIIPTSRALVPYDAAAAEARLAEFNATRLADGTPLTGREIAAIGRFNEALAATQDGATIQRMLSEGRFTELAAAREELLRSGLIAGPTGLTRLGSTEVLAEHLPGGTYLMTRLPVAEELPAAGRLAEGAPATGAGTLGETPLPRDIPPLKPGVSTDPFHAGSLRPPLNDVPGIIVAERTPFMIVGLAPEGPLTRLPAVLTPVQEGALARYNFAQAPFFSFRNFPGALTAADLETLLATETFMNSVGLATVGGAIVVTERNLVVAEYNPATGSFDPILHPYPFAEPVEPRVYAYGPTLRDPSFTPGDTPVVPGDSVPLTERPIARDPVTPTRTVTPTPTPTPDLVLTRGGGNIFAPENTLLPNIFNPFLNLFGIGSAPGRPGTSVASAPSQPSRPVITPTSQPPRPTDVSPTGGRTPQTTTPTAENPGLTRIAIARPTLVDLFRNPIESVRTLVTGERPAASVISPDELAALPTPTEPPLIDATKMRAIARYNDDIAPNVTGQLTKADIKAFVKRSAELRLAKAGLTATDREITITGTPKVIAAKDPTTGRFVPTPEAYGYKPTELPTPSMCPEGLASANARNVAAVVTPGGPCAVLAAEKTKRDAEIKLGIALPRGMPATIPPTALPTLEQVRLAVASLPATPRPTVAQTAIQAVERAAARVADVVTGNVARVPEAVPSVTRENGGLIPGIGMYSPRYGTLNQYHAQNPFVELGERAFAEGDQVAAMVFAQEKNRWEMTQVAQGKKPAFIVDQVVEDIPEAMKWLTENGITPVTIAEMRKFADDNGLVFGFWLHPDGDKAPIVARTQADLERVQIAPPGSRELGLALGYMDVSGASELAGPNLPEVAPIPPLSGLTAFWRDLTNTAPRSIPGNLRGTGYKIRILSSSPLGSGGDTIVRAIDGVVVGSGSRHFKDGERVNIAYKEFIKGSPGDAREESGGPTDLVQPGTSGSAPASEAVAESVTRRTFIALLSGFLGSTALPPNVLSRQLLKEASVTPVQSPLGTVVLVGSESDLAVELRNSSVTDYANAVWNSDFREAEFQSMQFVLSSGKPDRVNFVISKPIPEKVSSPCAAVCNIVIGTGVRTDGTKIAFVSRSLPTMMQPNGIFYDDVAATASLFDSTIRSLIEQSVPGSVKITMWNGGYFERADLSTQLRYSEPIQFLTTIVKAIDPALPLYVPVGVNVPEFGYGANSLDIYHDTPAGVTYVVSSPQMLTRIRENLGAFAAGNPAPVLSTTQPKLLNSASSLATIKPAGIVEVGNSMPISAFPSVNAMASAAEINAIRTRAYAANISAAEAKKKAIEANGQTMTEVASILNIENQAAAYPALALDTIPPAPLYFELPPVSDPLTSTPLSLLADRDVHTTALTTASELNAYLTSSFAQAGLNYTPIRVVADSFSDKPANFGYDTTARAMTVTINPGLLKNTILQNLPGATGASIQATIAHEYGHYVDLLLAPSIESYIAKNAVIKEQDAWQFAGILLKNSGLLRAGAYEETYYLASSCGYDMKCIRTGMPYVLGQPIPAGEYGRGTELANAFYTGAASPFSPAGLAFLAERSPGSLALSGILPQLNAINARSVASGIVQSRPPVPVIASEGPATQVAVKDREPVVLPPIASETAEIPLADRNLVQTRLACVVDGCFASEFWLKPLDTLRREPQAAAAMKRWIGDGGPGSLAAKFSDYISTNPSGIKLVLENAAANDMASLRKLSTDFFFHVLGRPEGDLPIVAARAELNRISPAESAKVGRSLQEIAASKGYVLTVDKPLSPFEPKPAPVRQGEVQYWLDLPGLDWRKKILGDQDQSTRLSLENARIQLENNSRELLGLPRISDNVPNPDARMALRLYLQFNHPTEAAFLERNQYRVSALTEFSGSLSAIQYVDQPAKKGFLLLIDAFGKLAGQNAWDKLTVAQKTTFLNRAEGIAKLALELLENPAAESRIAEAIASLPPDTTKVARNANRRTVSFPYVSELSDVRSLREIVTTVATQGQALGVDSVKLAGTEAALEALTVAAAELTPLETRLAAAGTLASKSEAPLVLPLDGRSLVRPGFGNFIINGRITLAEAVNFTGPDGRVITLPKKTEIDLGGAPVVVKAQLVSGDGQLRFPMRTIGYLMDPGILPPGSLRLVLGRGDTMPLHADTYIKTPISSDAQDAAEEAGGRAITALQEIEAEVPGLVSGVAVALAGADKLKFESNVTNMLMRDPAKSVVTLAGDSYAASMDFIPNLVTNIGMNFMPGVVNNQVGLRHSVIAADGSVTSSYGLERIVAGGVQADDLYDILTYGVPSFRKTSDDLRVKDGLEPEDNIILTHEKGTAVIATHYQGVAKTEDTLNTKGHSNYWLITVSPNKNAQALEAAQIEVERESAAARERSPVAGTLPQAGEQPIPTSIIPNPADLSNNGLIPRSDAASRTSINRSSEQRAAVARAIASGHAFDEHAAQFGIPKTEAGRVQFQEKIDATIRNATDYQSTGVGVHYYLDRNTQTLVVHDVAATDKGTMYPFKHADPIAKLDYLTTRTSKLDRAVADALSGQTVDIPVQTGILKNSDRAERNVFIEGVLAVQGAELLSSKAFPVNNITSLQNYIGSGMANAEFTPFPLRGGEPSGLYFDPTRNFVIIVDATAPGHGTIIPVTGRADVEAIVARMQSTSLDDFIALVDPTMNNVAATQAILDANNQPTAYSLDFRPRAATQPNRLVVALMDGSRELGTMDLKVLSSPRPAVYLEFIQVAPGVPQGQGYGTIMLRELQNILTRNNVPGILIDSVAEKSGDASLAVGMYQRNGWVEIPGAPNDGSVYLGFSPAGGALSDGASLVAALRTPSTAGTPRGYSVENGTLVIKLLTIGEVGPRTGESLAMQLEINGAAPVPVSVTIGTMYSKGSLFAAGGVYGATVVGELPAGVPRQVVLKFYEDETAEITREYMRSALTGYNLIKSALEAGKTPANAAVIDSLLPFSAIDEANFAIVSTDFNTGGYVAVDGANPNSVLPKNSIDPGTVDLNAIAQVQRLIIELASERSVWVSNDAYFLLVPDGSVPGLKPRLVLGDFDNIRVESTLSGKSEYLYDNGLSAMVFLDDIAENRLARYGSVEVKEAVKAAKAIINPDRASGMQSLEEAIYGTPTGPCTEASIFRVSQLAAVAAPCVVAPSGALRDVTRIAEDVRYIPAALFRNAAGELVTPFVPRNAAVGLNSTHFRALSSAEKELAAAVRELALTAPQERILEQVRAMREVMVTMAENSRRQMDALDNVRGRVGTGLSIRFQATLYEGRALTRDLVQTARDLKTLETTIIRSSAAERESIVGEFNELAVQAEDMKNVFTSFEAVLATTLYIPQDALAAVETGSGALLQPTSAARNAGLGAKPCPSLVFGSGLSQLAAVNIPCPVRSEEDLQKAAGVVGVRYIPVSVLDRVAASYVKKYSTALNAQGLNASHVSNLSNAVDRLTDATRAHMALEPRSTLAERAEATRNLALAMSNLVNRQAQALENIGGRIPPEERAPFYSQAAEGVRLAAAFTQNIRALTAVQRLAQMSRPRLDRSAIAAKFDQVALETAKLRGQFSKFQTGTASALDIPLVSLATVKRPASVVVPTIEDAPAKPGSPTQPCVVSTVGETPAQLAAGGIAADETPSPCPTAMPETLLNRTAKLRDKALDIETGVAQASAADVVALEKLAADIRAALGTAEVGVDILERAAEAVDLAAKAVRALVAERPAVAASNNVSLQQLLANAERSAQEGYPRVWLDSAELSLSRHEDLLALNQQPAVQPPAFNPDNFSIRDVLGIVDRPAAQAVPPVVPPVMPVQQTAPPRTAPKEASREVEIIERRNEPAPVVESAVIESESTYKGNAAAYVTEAEALAAYRKAAEDFGNNVPGALERGEDAAESLMRIAGSGQASPHVLEAYRIEQEFSAWQVEQKANYAALVEARKKVLELTKPYQAQIDGLEKQINEIKSVGEDAWAEIAILRDRQQEILAAAGPELAAATAEFDALSAAQSRLVGTMPDLSDANRALYRAAFGEEPVFKPSQEPDDELYKIWNAGVAKTPEKPVKLSVLENIRLRFPYIVNLFSPPPAGPLVGLEREAMDKLVMRAWTDIHGIQGNNARAGAWIEVNGEWSPAEVFDWMADNHPGDMRRYSPGTIAEYIETFMQAGNMRSEVMKEWAKFEGIRGSDEEIERAWSDAKGKEWSPAELFDGWVSDYPEDIAGARARAVAYRVSTWIHSPENVPISRETPDVPTPVVESPVSVPVRSERGQADVKKLGIGSIDDLELLPEVELLAPNSILTPAEYQNLQYSMELGRNTNGYLQLLAHKLRAIASAGEVGSDLILRTAVALEKAAAEQAYNNVENLGFYAQSSLDYLHTAEQQRNAAGITALTDAEQAAIAKIPEVSRVRELAKNEANNIVQFSKAVEQKVQQPLPAPELSPIAEVKAAAAAVVEVPFTPIASELSAEAKALRAELRDEYELAQDRADSAYMARASLEADSPLVLMWESVLRMEEEAAQVLAEARAVAGADMARAQELREFARDLQRQADTIADTLAIQIGGERPSLPAIEAPAISLAENEPAVSLVQPETPPMSIPDAVPEEPLPQLEPPLEIVRAENPTIALRPAYMEGTPGASVESVQRMRALAEEFLPQVQIAQAKMLVAQDEFANLARGITPLNKVIDALRVAELRSAIYAAGRDAHAAIVEASVTVGTMNIDALKRAEIKITEFYRLRAELEVLEPSVSVPLEKVDMPVFVYKPGAGGGSGGGGLPPGRGSGAGRAEDDNFPRRIVQVLNTVRVLLQISGVPLPQEPERERDLPSVQIIPKKEVPPPIKIIPVKPAPEKGGGEVDPRKKPEAVPPEVPIKKDPPKTLEEAVDLCQADPECSTILREEGYPVYDKDGRITHWVTPDGRKIPLTDKEAESIIRDVLKYEGPLDETRPVPEPKETIPPAEPETTPRCPGGRCPEKEPVGPRLRTERTRPDAVPPTPRRVDATRPSGDSPFSGLSGGLPGGTNPTQLLSLLNGLLSPQSGTGTSMLCTLFSVGCPAGSQQGNSTGTPTCARAPERPATSTCPNGKWLPTSALQNGCTTGWQCVVQSTTSPIFNAPISPIQSAGLAPESGGSTGSGNTTGPVIPTNMFQGMTVAQAINRMASDTYAPGFFTASPVQSGKPTAVSTVSGAVSAIATAGLSVSPGSVALDPQVTLSMFLTGFSKFLVAYIGAAQAAPSSLTYVSPDLSAPAAGPSGPIDLMPFLQSVAAFLQGFFK